MVGIGDQNTKNKLQLYLSLLALALIGCYGPGVPEEQAAIESPESVVAKPRTLYLEVSYDDSTYQLIHAHISDTVFTRGPIIRVAGIYGVQVVTEDNEISFDQYTWLKPINGLITLPFSDDTAFIEFIHRKGDRMIVIGRFSREDILSVAT